MRPIPNSSNRQSNLNDDEGKLNDLWMFNLTSGCWLWLSGNHSVDQLGVYGVRGVASPENMPGGRMVHAMAYDDTHGVIYVHGGMRFTVTTPAETGKCPYRIRRPNRKLRIIPKVTWTIYGRTM